MAERHVHLLRVLNELNNDIAEATDLIDAFNFIVQTIRNETGAGTCISLIEEEQNFQVWVDTDRRESRYCYLLPEQAVEREVLKKGTGRICYPKRQEVEVTLLPLLEYQTLFILPISYKAKELGILYVFREDECYPPACVTEFLEQVAKRIGIAVKNWQREQDSRYKERKLKLLYDIMLNAADVETDRTMLIKDACWQISAAFDDARVMIGQVDREKNKVEIACSTSPYPEEWADSLFLFSGTGRDFRHVEAFFTGNPVVVQDGKKDKRCSQVAEKLELYSNATIPIIYKDEPLGVIYLDNKDYRTFSEVQLGFLMVIARQLGMVITNARQYEHIRMLAITDGLTRLHTRQYFTERYAEEYALAVRYRTPLCLIMMDIDDFKRINDTYGHVAGDNVLIETAKTIQEQVRKNDIVARYGGEELILLLPNTELENGILIANRIQDSLSMLPFSFSVTASIGVAQYPDHSADREELLMRADDAMYRAKHEGKNQIRIAQRTHS